MMRHSGLIPPALPPLPTIAISYYAQPWCRKSLFECCIYWHLPCLSLSLSLPHSLSLCLLGAFRFLSVLRHHVTQFPFCWTNLVSVHKFMCTIRGCLRLWLCALRFVVIYCILLGGFSYFVQQFLAPLSSFFWKLIFYFLFPTHWLAKRQGLKWLLCVCLCIAFDLVFVVI